MSATQPTHPDDNDAPDTIIGLDHTIAEPLNVGTQGLTIHTITHDDTAPAVTVCELNGRYEIGNILKHSGKRWAPFINPRRAAWTNISRDLLRAPTVIIYTKHSIPNIPIKKLYFVPEQLLQSVFVFCRNNPLCVAVDSHIGETYQRPVLQFPEFKCHVMADKPDEKGRRMVLARMDTNPDFYNVDLTVMSVLKLTGRDNVSVSRYLHTIDTRKYVTALVAELYPDRYTGIYDTDLTLVYRDKYGIKWMHRDLIMRYIQSIDVHMEIRVNRLMSRIISGDFAVVSDIIGIIDQVNNTETLAEFWTYDKVALSQNADLLRHKDEVINRLNSQVNALSRANLEADRSLAIATTQLSESSNHIKALTDTMSSDSRELVDKMVNIFGRRANIADVFGQVDEMCGQSQQEIDRLKRELEALQQENSNLNSEIERSDQTNNDLQAALDGVHVTVKEATNTAHQCRRYASSIIHQMATLGFPIKLSAPMRRVMMDSLVAKVEAGFILIDTKRKAAIEERLRRSNRTIADLKLPGLIDSDRPAGDFSLKLDRINEVTGPETKGPESTADVVAAVANGYVSAPATQRASTLTSAPATQRASTLTSAPATHLYIYIVTHRSGSLYHDWVRYDLGDICDTDTGCTVVLTTTRRKYGKSTNTQLACTIVTSEVATRDYDEEWNVDELRTNLAMDLATYLHHVVKSQEYEPFVIKRATESDLVAVFQQHGPKKIERSICSGIWPRIKHKIDYAGNIIHKWDNYVAEYTPWMA